MSITGRMSDIMKLVCLAVFLAGIFISNIYALDMCIECHKDVTFRTRNPALFEYYRNWQDSLHEIEGVSCSDCHGGNPAEKEKEAAHKDNFSSLTSGDRASFKKIPQRCGTCHEAILKHFMESRHYRALIEKGTGPHCSTCHGSMNSNVYYTSVIVRACRDCHNEYTKNLPEVVGEADKILHRINVSQAFKRWILINYDEDEPEKVEEILTLYDNVAESWHTFRFKELDQKSQDLLNKMKALRTREIEKKRKKTGEE